MFEELLNNRKGWLNGEGPDSDIVISTRIRVARNIDGYPFPWKASLSYKQEIIKKVRDIIPKIETMSSSSFIKMDTVNSLDKQFLLERHLVSQEHIRSSRGKALVFSEREDFSVMVNEEDHLRLQAIFSGFDLDKTWAFVNQLDEELSKHLVFSFSPQLGYLTACPTNVGTALRASCMLHLPGLVLTKQITRILELLAKLSFTSRGLFGEGTQALGNFFQISNQATLGFNEEEIIDSLKGVVRQVRDSELSARENLLNKYRRTLEDSIWRSFGVLSNCRLISTKEAFSHLSMLCLGVDLGIIKDIERSVINNLFVIIQPAHLQKIEGEALQEEERDYIRASVIRANLIANNA